MSVCREEQEGHAGKYTQKLRVNVPMTPEMRKGIDEGKRTDNRKHGKRIDEQMEGTHGDTHRDPEGREEIHGGASGGDAQGNSGGNGHGTGDVRPSQEPRFKI